MKGEVHHDKNGRSLGTATVMYTKAQEAQKAVRQYHNVPLDGMSAFSAFQDIKVSHLLCCEGLES